MPSNSSHETFDFGALSEINGLLIKKNNTQRLWVNLEARYTEEPIFKCNNTAVVNNLINYPRELIYAYIHQYEHINMNRWICIIMNIFYIQYFSSVPGWNWNSVKSSQHFWFIYKLTRCHIHLINIKGIKNE